MTSAPPQFDATHRLLVLAPHPDDETIAAGILIQSAIASGADVRVVFVTDGDNNPWPQRWLERRWRIGPADRERWGGRRRRETLAALAVLGVEEASARFLGWPDQGLTDCLMRGGEAETALAGEIAAFAPTHVVLPTLTDRHPDHSALSVLVDLVLMRNGPACERLGYVLHGPPPAAATIPQCSDPGLQQRKQQALLSYATQVSLSRGRLLRLAGRPESFERIENARGVRPADSDDLVLHLPLPPLPGRAHLHSLLVVLAGQMSTVRGCIRLPPLRKMRHATTLAMRGMDGSAARIECSATALRVTIPGAAAGLLRGYVKLERDWPRLLIFDAAGWRDVDDCLAPDNVVLPDRDRHLAARAVT
ncbi:MAG TPA: PIG-L family deacetylase [Rhodanobacteraceae bacterium]|nr:PIG-L family deacetylase [Rhodanobacteraceae bacterium]